MKNYIKYICAFVLLMGMSVNVWGTTCTLYGGLNGATTITTITNGQTIPACSTAGGSWNIATNWASKTYWTTTKYSSSSPTTTKPSGSYLYMSGDVLPDGITALYAVYVFDGTYYSGAPGYQIDLTPATGDSWAEAPKYMAIQPGTSITITAHPDDGKVVTEWIVLDGEGEDITPTSTTATTFVFSMPSGDVTAEVRFGDPCTSRTVTFANNITKDFGTDPGKYQDYTLSAGSGTVTWSSDNDAIASVNSSGVVTLNKAGSTYINVEVAEDGTYCAVSDWYKITVNEVTPTLSSTASGKELTVSGITAHGATFSGGVVTFKGNATVNSYGYIVGTSSDVTYATRVTQAGTNEDVDLNTAFESKSVTGLTPGTTYYVRPMANNKTQIGYGTAVSFTTLAEYDIDLDKNNSDVGSADGTATVVENATSIEIVAPTRTGYSVEGYYTTDGLETKVATAAGALQSGITVSATNWTDGSSQWVKAGGATFYTKWTAKEYTVTLNQNGGSGGSTGITATYGSAMPAATMPTTPPTGKTFDGYYYNSVKYYNSDGSSAHVWDVDDDVTLVASWTTSTPTLTIASVDNIVISSTSPSLAEGAYSSVAYNTTVTLSHGEPASGYYWLDWNVYETGNEGNTVTVTNNQFAMPDFDVTVSANLYTGLVFSCAELTLTPVLVTASTPIFITSAANKTVRSQDYIEITGNGLTPSTELTFPCLPSKFAIKKADGTALATNSSGVIEEDAYIFYTPDAEDTSDGLDKLTGITVSVGGAKPKQVTLVQEIIGRHLPTAGYVIAGKKDNKWYALPATMSTGGTPDPVEIAVDNIDNPSIAYTAASNIYGLEGPTASNISGKNGQYVRLTMSQLTDGTGAAGPAPLYASTTANIGKNGAASATSDLSAGFWWALTQKNTSITNPQDAKYNIKSPNNGNTLSIKNDPFQWGSYASGVEELRLIPASSVVPTEAEIVAWGKNEAIIEVDQPTIGATSVIGKLPGDIESEKITLSQTGTSVKGTGTRYNYTVDFGEGVDFSANEGKMLTLEWYNALDQLVAVSNVTVPKIVASDITISKANYTNKSVWNTEVHVLPGKTVTVDASAYDGSNVTVKELNIYPGATVTVTGGTLIPTTLVLRNGWSRIGEKKYDIARLHIASTGSVGSTTAYADWYIDYDQYYPIAVPWKVATASISYENMTVATSAGLFVRYYDGERHAKGGKDGDGNTNWKQYTWGDDMPEYLVPGIGYAMTARRPAGKAFSIIRMPLTIPSADWTTNGEQGEVSDVHKDQVSVTAWVKDEGETPKHAKGWNCIANPYMCMYEGAITHSEGEDYNIEYVNIPDVNFKEFDQVATDKAKLKPGSAFLIQTEETGTLTFGTSNRKASAPSFLAQTPKASKQKAYITLSGEEVEDEMGLIISERYTEEYEINADLEKLLSDGNTLRTYMIYNDINMAYVAINEDLAKEWIPVTVRIPEAGEYTFSLHEASKISELEGVYLIDYETNTVTNLIESNYSFVAAEGTIDNRFAINAIVGRHETPTDIDIINAGGDINSDKPVKFIYNDKVFILHNGVIYDSTGKKVREINR